MPNILIIAAEPSGSRLGADLMAELNSRVKGQVKEISWQGVGGAEMEAQGLHSLFPLTDLAVMGLAEVIPAIPRILCRLRQIEAAAKAAKPDVIITIDGQDFSQRVAQRLKPLGVPHVHYVAPKVWAWRQGRVHKLKHLYTHLLCNLPFEAAWFAAAGLPTTYVGHAAVQALAGVAIPPHPAQQLALLPGSRSSELARHWPIMLATYRRLRQLIPSLTALLALNDAAALQKCRALAPWQTHEGIEVVLGEDRFTALAQCRAALAKSGTNTLELALLNLPAVVCYRMHWLTYAIAKHLVKLPSFSLPNLLLSPPPLPGVATNPIQLAPVYPEFLQAAAKPQNLARALYPLLTQTKPYQAQQAKLGQIKRLLATPKTTAAAAAEVIMGYLPAK